MTTDMPLTGLCDLHTHSLYSDGTCAPEEILRSAERCGLSAVALCDHNTIAGIPAFLRAGETSSVEAVAGVEITAEYNRQEIHILGLFVPEASFRELNAFLGQIRAEKDHANSELFRRLTHAGYRLSLRRIEEDGKGMINRVHFARELVRCGYVSSIAEGFRGVLSEKNGLYRPPARREGLEVISLLRELSAVPVLAHPFLNLGGEDLRGFLPRAAAQGLLAMETRYSLFDEAATRQASALAAEFGLLESGGSDFHGANKPDIALGSGRGDLRVPVSFRDALKFCLR